MNAELIERARNEQDWKGFVFAHEKPGQPSAMKQISDRLTDREYWKLVRLVWTHADRVWETKQLWKDILTAPRSSRPEIMEEEERHALAKLDDPVLIFRGHTEHNRDGWSWTRSWSLAKDFAKTPNGWPLTGTPKVTKAFVRCEKVIAYLTLLEEEEIILDPDDAYEHESMTIYPSD